MKGFIILSLCASLFFATTCAFAQEAPEATPPSGSSKDAVHVYVSKLNNLEKEAIALINDINTRVHPVKQEWANEIKRACDSISSSVGEAIKSSHNLIVAGSLNGYELTEKGFQGGTFIAKLQNFAQRLDLFEADGETPVNFKYIPLSRIVDGKRVVSVYAVAYTGYDGSGYSVFCDADLYDGERKENGIVINLGLIKRGTYDSAIQALINDGMPGDQIAQLFPNHMIAQK